MHQSQIMVNKKFFPSKKKKKEKKKKNRRPFKHMQSEKASFKIK